MVSSREPEVQPYVESSDSDHSSSESDDESSNSEYEEYQTEEDSHDMSNNSHANTAEIAPKCFVTFDGRKLWTPTCDDKQKPFLGQYFGTLEDAYIFYKEYGRMCGFDVRKSSERSDRRGNLQAKLIQCNRGGNPVKKLAKTIDDFVGEGSKTTRRTTSRRCDCKARIVMKPAGQRGVVVMSFVEEHNHPMETGRGKMFLRCNRDVSLAYQNFIMDCSRANIGPTRAYTLAKEMVGSYEDVGATVEDFKNFSQEVKLRIGDHDVDMLLAKFKLKKETSNNTFYYDYKVDRKGHLTGIFWTDAIGQANFEVFGDIVSFDPTFRTNRYNMVFVPFTGVDNHWKNVTFAAGLLAKEDYKNFKWLINTFRTAMGRAPTIVVTDECKAIKKALFLHWESTKHRLCMWHIMNKLPAKIGPKLAADKKFMSKFKSVIYSEHMTPHEFEAGWKDVIAEYKLEGNRWLSGKYAARKDWIPVYFTTTEMAGLLRTTSRSESSNSFFQHFHECGDTLVEFYSSFESAMDKQRLRNADEDTKSARTPHLETTMLIEKNAADIYTLELYYLVLEEIKEACFHTSMTDMTRDNEARHFLCKDDLLDGRIFKVSVRHEDNHVKCSCNLFFRKGYPCRHAFAALKQCSVHKIPRSLIKPRWVKNAVHLYSTLGSTEVPANTKTIDRAKLKRSRAWFEFNNHMKYAGDDEQKIDVILSGLHSIGSELPQGAEGLQEDTNVHRVDKFIGPVTHNEVTVHNPHQSRNKGCGSRIKSSKEISMSAARPRKCGLCGKTDGHNARTCTNIPANSDTAD